MTSHRILIVDDEPHAIRVLRLSIERAGYSVDTACSGAEALLKATQSMPDLIITDLQMPGGDGKTFCETLRKQYPEHPVPILIMSSMTALDSRTWVRQYQNIEFLEKPLSPRNLVAKLQALLAQPASEMETGHV